MKAWNKVVNKWLNRGKRRTYLIHEQNDKYALCKVLNKYDDKKDAVKDMVELASNEVTENDILDKRED
jgi:hypothetical protein